MQPVPLRRLLDSRGYTSGIRKLDESLRSGDGFGAGIYDLCGSVGVSNLGIYELTFNVMIQHLMRFKKVLYVQSTHFVPWFKLKNDRRYRKDFDEQIDILKVDNLVEFIILFKSNPQFFHDYSFLVFDSFSGMYENHLKILKSMNKSGSFNECVIRFFESIRKVLSIVQRICFEDPSNMKTVFTLGNMDIFNQKIRVPNVEDPDDSDSSDNTNANVSSTSSTVNQQIMVPTISLKSNLNSYYVNRIIFYRDWIYENERGILAELNLTSIDLVVPIFNKDMIKTLSHFLCITPNPLDHNNKPQKGFFLIDNKFQIIDIAAGSQVANQSLQSGDIEIPDSQSE